MATPDLPPDDLIPSFLAASDVLGTGWFAAVAPLDQGPPRSEPVAGADLSFAEPGPGVHAHIDAAYHPK